MTEIWPLDAAAITSMALPYGELLDDPHVVLHQPGEPSAKFDADVDERIAKLRRVAGAEALLLLDATYGYVASHAPNDREPLDVIERSVTIPIQYARVRSGRAVPPNERTILDGIVTSPEDWFQLGGSRNVVSYSVYGRSLISSAQNGPGCPALRLRVQQEGEKPQNLFIAYWRTLLHTYGPTLELGKQSPEVIAARKLMFGPR